MDLARKTEIVDDRIFQTLVDLSKEYEGKIKISSDSNYDRGTIIIKIKE